uniref:NAD-dependent epimerase/dehydratase domain-containing protein n=1 Tax=Gossypium raimondii TaxID=29730 RepID=A0A0D2TTS0_GOSRA|nr:hypothetical protein B456_009G291200 [Gossypium raimondii]
MFNVISKASKCPMFPMYCVSVFQKGHWKSVCVTGAGGYLGSWVVKHLLSNNYTVHGTVRQPGDAKYAHLNQLERAPHNLQLFKANVLDYGSLCSAIAGCTGVFHVASPVPSTIEEVIEPAVKGTLNVLKACVESNVKRVVVVSSGSAVSLNPRWPVEGYDTLENKLRKIVDVRDVAQALLLVYEKPAAEGRYICTAHTIKARDLVDKLRSMFPQYNYPKSFTEVGEEDMISSEKLQRLGWSYRPLEETLVDSIESYKKAGILD